MKAFEKPQKHLQVEDTFRTFYEQSGDTAYQLPHSFDYYEKKIHQAVERYPDSLTLKKCASAIGEEAFFPEGTDVVFHLHLSWFPPIWHTTEFFVMQVVTNGSFTSYIANQELHLTRGNICIIAPDSRHALSCFSHAGILCVLIRKSAFEKAFLNILRETDNILADFFTKTLYSNNPHPFLYFNCEWDSHLMKILSMAYMESNGHRSFREPMVRSLMEYFYLTLLRDHEKDLIFPDFTSVRHSENLIFMLKYLQEHYTTIRLPEIAQLFNYSERQVQRILRRSTGLSFTELVQSMRMKEAARLLRDSRYPVSRIAVDVGYANQGNFRKIFQNTYHMSPAEYRRSMTK